MEVIIKDKLITLKSEFERYFKERSEEIAGAFLALLSKEHVLFIGPPGTAKSLLAKKICETIKGGKFFYYLLTRFTTPEEIFGPLSIKALQEDEFKRKIDNYLPTAHIAFLDEIFKANSSILNSLLTILNERKFHNGSEVVDVPLITVFGASNELPEENESLEALYDRFLFRYNVENIQNEDNFKEMILGNAEDFQPSMTLTIDELNEVREKAEKIKLDDDTMKIILALRRLFKQENIFISDRRWKKIINVLKVASASIGKNSVDKTMILLLQHMLWDTPDQKEGIKQRLINYIVSSGMDISALEKRITYLYEAISDDLDYELSETISCYNCDAKFYTLKELEEHHKKYRNHTYKLPSRYGCRYDEVISYLKKNKLLKLKIPSVKLEIYKKEYVENENEFRKLLKVFENERSKLKQLLDSNIWLTQIDRDSILSVYDEKRKKIYELEKKLGEIKEMLKIEDAAKNT